MRHVWSVLCGATSIDVRTNNISLFDVRERIVFQLDNQAEQQLRQQIGFLPVPLRVEFVTMWMRDNLDVAEVANTRVVLVTPASNEQILFEVEIDLSNHPRNRSLSPIQGIPFEGNGVYLFIPQVYKDEDWHVVAEIPLEVIQEKN